MTSRDRMVVVLLAVGAVLAGAWFVVVAPRRAKAADQQQQITQARQARDAAVQQLAAGRTARHDYAADHAAFAELGKAVPEQDDMASLLYQLQDAAGRSHVALTSVAPGAAVSPAPAAPAPAPSGGQATAAPAAAPSAAAPSAAAPAVAAPSAILTVPIALSFEGTYRDLERFLRRVHRLTIVRGDKVSVRGRLVSVQAVQLSRPDPTAGPIRATVSASVYTAAIPAPAAGGATAAAPIPAVVTGGAP